MKTKSMTITQILIFDYDQIPLRKLISRRNLTELGSLFEFSNAQVAEDISEGKKAVILDGGTLENETEPVAIPRVVVEERRILLSVDGSSKQADQVYEHLGKFLAALAGLEATEFQEFRHKSEESEVVAELDFAFERLVSNPVWEFMRTEIPAAASTEIFSTSTVPAHFSFFVEYQPTDEWLSSHRISLARKEFSLEPRIGHPLEEQIYFSKAPLDTEAHLSLLGRIEDLLSNK